MHRPLQLLVWICIFSAMMNLVGCVTSDQRYRNWNARMGTVPLGTPIDNIYAWAGPPDQVTTLGRYVEQKPPERQEQVAEALWAGHMWIDPDAEIGWGTIEKSHDGEAWWKNPQMAKLALVVYETPEWYRDVLPTVDRYLFAIWKSRIVAKFNLTNAEWEKIRVQKEGG